MSANGQQRENPENMYRVLYDQTVTNEPTSSVLVASVNLFPHPLLRQICSAVGSVGSADAAAADDCLGLGLGATYAACASAEGVPFTFITFTIHRSFLVLHVSLTIKKVQLFFGYTLLRYADFSFVN